MDVQAFMQLKRAEAGIGRDIHRRAVRLAAWDMAA